ncbi:hypothetical protein DPMN_143488 [Dreissena polymorpha]|uniref:Uncharacterized protein n=1 Tax=Dreissena polymorpha TaxID=45954 RepID=A0A9D4JLQ7_DREPO|nr:hypothetical protein DPMN_143488 [Dreissena polymorpha]
MADKDITFVVSIDGQEHHIIASATLVEALNSDDHSTRQHAYEYILSVLRQESLPENERPERYFQYYMDKITNPAPA